jgi:hypothetical protein
LRYGTKIRSRSSGCPQGGCNSEFAPHGPCHRRNRGASVRVLPIPMPETPSQISPVREDYRASNPGRGNLLATRQIAAGQRAVPTQAKPAALLIRHHALFRLGEQFGVSRFNGPSAGPYARKPTHHQLQPIPASPFPPSPITNSPDGPYIAYRPLDQPTINVFSPPPDLSRHEQNGIPFWIKRRHTPPSALNRSSFMSVYFESSSVSTSGRPRAERRHASATTQEGSNLGGT